MQRVHRAKWNSKHVQENRAAEQAVRDEMKQEAQATYGVFKDLDLQIVVDLRSFTVSEQSEPVEIVLPETGSQSALSEGQKPVLVAPAPHTRTKFKTPSFPTASTVKRAPVKSNRKQVKPRQSNVFKRFTLLVVEYIREKFVWARKKPAPVSVEADHDKRMAENYVFDEVQGIYVPRSEHEKRARFNSDTYSPTKEEIRRFPSRPKHEQPESCNSLDPSPSIPSEQANKYSIPRLRPPGSRNDRDTL